MITFRKNYNKEGEGRVFLPLEEPSNSLILVINQWYRYKLGKIDTKEVYKLNISIENNWLGKILACLDHPQVIVRIATILGIISVIETCLFGIIGIISLI